MPSRIALILTVAFLSAPRLSVAAQPAPRVPRVCTPTVDGVEHSVAGALHAGEYDLVVIATSGIVRDTIAAGPLWLWEATAADRSPHTGQPAVDDVRVVLHGATDAPLRRVMRGRAR
jgi:hypothetical protein